MEVGKRGSSNVTTPRLPGADQRALTVLEKLSDAELEAVLPRVVDAPVSDMRWIREQETYYSSRTEPRPTPALRGQFSDARATWVYLDPATASVALVSDRIGRYQRWGYVFLHGFDLPWLLRHRLLRDSLMILFMSGGTALSITGVWVAVLWLAKARQHGATQGSAPRPRRSGL
ncbi:MAG: hypothetical protein U0163_10965 [Gemmatimonadaceae bacterium]